MMNRTTVAVSAELVIAQLFPGVPALSLSGARYDPISHVVLFEISGPSIPPDASRCRAVVNVERVRVDFEAIP